MFITAADVFLRYVFNRPITGSVELNELMLVLVVFFSLAKAAVRKSHVSIELITGLLPENVRNLLNTISSIIVIIFSILLTWQAFELGLVKWEKGLTSTVLRIPVYPVIIFYALCCALFCLVILLDFFQGFKGIVETSKKKSDWIVPLIGTAVVAGAVGVTLLIFPYHLTPAMTGYVGMIIMVILLFSGIPIGIVMALIGFGGMAYLASPEAGLGQLGSVPFVTASNYSFCVVPLFILMGSFAYYTGLGKDVYNTVNKWLGHLPGGLAMATVGGCAGFAAISGSSVATAATMGTVALPEMKRFNYSDALATGCLAAGGSIGILIPPSVVLLIYGILTNISISELFIAGLLPGITQAILYLVMIYILCRKYPHLGPKGEQHQIGDKIKSLKDTWGILFLFVLVMGGLYAGIFTPTEAGGIGAFGAFVLTIFKRKLKWSTFITSLSDTGVTSAMVFLILIGAMMLGYFLTITRIPFILSDFVSALPVNRYVILILILVIYLSLGCIMDSLSIILLTVPIFFPVIQNLQFNPIWFGILITRVSEMGLITPPVGMNVFVIQGVAKDVPIQTIFRGIIPFIMTDFVHLAILIAIPQLTLIFV